MTIGIALHDDVPLGVSHPSQNPGVPAGRSAHDFTAKRGQFELVAGPSKDRSVASFGSRRRHVLFSTVDEAGCFATNHASKAIADFAAMPTGVNGLALGPNGEIYGAQEGGRRLVEIHSPTGRTIPVDALLDGKHHNQRAMCRSTGRASSISPPAPPDHPFGPSTFRFSITAPCWRSKHYLPDLSMSMRGSPAGGAAGAAPAVCPLQQAGVDRARSFAACRDRRWHVHHVGDSWQ